MDHVLSNPLRSQALDRAAGEKLARLKEKVPPDGYAQPPRIALGRFFDEGFFAAEQKYLWPNAWVYAAHDDELPSPGSYVRFDHLGVPIVLIKGADRNVRAFYNTCPHRGAPIVLDQCGTQKGMFTCPFHAWSFDSQGTLRGVPMQHEFGCLDRAENNLRQIRCESLGKMIFVNRNVNAPPLRVALGERFSDDFEQFGYLDKLKILRKRTFEVDINWKNVIHAFTEVYHLPIVHRKSAVPVLGTSKIVNVNMLMPNGNTGMYTLAPSPTSEDRGADTNFDDWKHIRNHNAFPNFLTSLPNGAHEFWLAMIPWPVSTGKTRIEEIFFFNPDGSLTDSDAARQHVLDSVDTIVGEDVVLMNGQYRSMTTGAIDGILVGNEESNIHHFEQHVDRAIGIEHIPEHLRVTPYAWPEVG
jgi:phenylpropionate dioxygenase-like ring-hydroxylating dioxygenase large terminal subunit